MTSKCRLIIIKLMVKEKSSSHVWISFVGVMLLLVGIYAGVKTGINILAFDKYPQNGVLSVLNFGSSSQYYQQEKDCYFTQTTYFLPDGKTPRAATSDEKVMEKKQQELCVQGVSFNRDNTKANDIGQAMLFLFLGVGILVSKKLFLR